MNIYYLESTTSTNGYVIVAETVDEARRHATSVEDSSANWLDEHGSEVVLLGTATEDTEAGVILGGN